MSKQTEVEVNPKKWRFYWESQSQVPILKLQLWNPKMKPSGECSVHLIQEKSVLEVRWEEEVLRVPLPNVLVDFDCPLSFKVFEECIQVKLCLLLSVDHPMFSTFLDNVRPPLTMDYDVHCLSAMGGVYFFCTNCSTKLTTSLRTFKEMPSLNWREVADNWFGNCCCSFGAITENLVMTYAKSYATTTGLCLLNTSSVILSKDDLIGFNNQLHSPVNNTPASNDDTTMSFHGQTKTMDDIHTRLNKLCSFKDNLTIQLKHSLTSSPPSPTVENVIKVPSTPRNHVQDHNDKCCDHSGTEPSANERVATAFGLLENQKSFLDGYLGNVFMARTSNLSKDVQWVELSCPCCSCLLGAYPCGSGDVVFDGGVHLFKCYISTCSDARASRNLFRMYTLEKMFSSQLLECAKDELSFRTVVRDLQTKLPMLKIVLLNPNSWCCFGYCSSTVEQIPRINMSPAIKLLFSDCSKSDECELRMIEEWVVKNQADEVYMLASQIKELIKSLELVKNVLPPSHTLLQGFSLSSLRM